MEYPPISILTPTYNRPEFIPLALCNIKGFDYDKKKLEWVILDDHPTNPFIPNSAVLDKVKKLLAPVKGNYVYDPKRHLTIGEKRNKLVKLAKYNYIANMDDDDVFFPSYLKHSIEIMKTNNYGLVGCPEMLFVFPHHDFQISYINCPSKRQAHESSMVTTKKYVKSMGGFPKSSQGEGAKLVDFNEKRVGRTNIKKCMCCVAHSTNTCNKDRFLQDKIEGRISEMHKRILCDIFNLEYQPPN